jgi:phospho-N-acetylmuramoyl-pentapeptide-transferase
MIPLLLAPLSDDFILFNLARYLTFRAGAACMTSLFIALVFASAQTFVLSRFWAFRRKRG